MHDAIVILPKGAKVSAHAAKAVLVAIAHAGTRPVSDTELAWMTQTARQTVRWAVEALVRIGWVIAEAVALPIVYGGRGMKRYTVLGDRLAAAAVRSPGHAMVRRERELAGSADRALRAAQELVTRYADERGVSLPGLAHARSRRYVRMREEILLTLDSTPGIGGVLSDHALGSVLGLKVPYAARAIIERARRRGREQTGTTTTSTGGRR